MGYVVLSSAANIGEEKPPPLIGELLMVTIENFIIILCYSILQAG
jgi:hypothetical protein